MLCTYLSCMYSVSLGKTLIVSTNLDRGSTDYISLFLNVIRLDLFTYTSLDSFLPLFMIQWNTD